MFACILGAQKDLGEDLRELAAAWTVIISVLPASAVGRSLHVMRCVTTLLLARLAYVHAPWRPCTRCTLALHHLEHLLHTAATVCRQRIERRLRRWRGRPQVDDMGCFLSARQRRRVVWAAPSREMRASALQS